MAEIKLEVPVTTEEITKLQAGDRVLLSGTVYTARDAAHQRLVEALHKGEELPFDLAGSAIYYVGPAPAKPEAVIGSAGPTTSYRMDEFTPLLLQEGLKVMIGKGDRSQEVINSMQQEKAVYLGATGGAAALIAECITDVEVIAYSDLGPEAVRKLEVEELPLICVIDSQGNNLYRKQ